ncbi:hypothetical protein ONZ51_g3080 [Trametes cubensis]|uniref:Uncharacterized protein n=1 Tax=Trametes cubensis TaxID=1111947 RepID=A0AAD7U0V3_9APHY|nr:hypothetical protein ONZ51_g3080 [Trametes cubensis]
MPKSGSAPVERPSRVKLSREARKFRRDHAEVFGYDLSQEGIHNLHQLLVERYGMHEYKLKNLQNWFSAQRRDRILVAALE